MTERPVDWHRYPAVRDNMGRPSQTRWIGDCPFCSTRDIVAYLWSLSGSGKCCPGCRALLTVSGASKRVE